MKTNLLLFMVLCSVVTMNGQCEAATLNNTVPVDNSGGIGLIGNLLNDEFIILNNLISNDTYTIDKDTDLIPPDTEAHLTLRRVDDNSVIAFGYTPLTFSTDITEVEIHFFDEEDCANIFDLIILSATNESTLGILEESFQYELDAYPNPTNNEVNIKSPTTIKSIEIINMTGKQLNKFSPNSKQFKIDLSNYKLGIYFLRLTTTENTTTSKKVIKR